MPDEKDAYLQAREASTRDTGYVDADAMWKAGIEYARRTPFSFNMNDRVRVKLTPEGRAALEADWTLLNMRMPCNVRHQYVPPQEDANGYSEWFFWVLMQSLGHHITHGGPLMFETTLTRVAQ